MLKTALSLGAVALIGLASCTEVPAPSGGSTEAPVTVELEGASYSVALGDVRTSCSDPALAELECAEVAVRAKVTRAGAAFAGTEDERAAARQVIGKACEARAMKSGRFTPTDGVFQGGMWVFDEACGS